MTKITFKNDDFFKISAKLMIFSILLKFWKKIIIFCHEKNIIFCQFFFKILKFFKTNSKFWKNLHFLPKFWKNNHLAMLFIVATLLWQYMTVLFKCRLVLFSVVLEGLMVAHYYQVEDKIYCALVVIRAQNQFHEIFVKKIKSFLLFFLQNFGKSDCNGEMG